MAIKKVREMVVLYGKKKLHIIIAELQ